MQPTEPVIPPKPAQLRRNTHPTQTPSLPAPGTVCLPASTAEHIPITTNELHHKAMGLPSSGWKENGERATYWVLQLHYPLLGILFRKGCAAPIYVSSVGTNIASRAGLSQHRTNSSHNR